MIEKKYINQDMNIELTSYIDNKQNVWFRGKDVAEILGYSDTRHALKRHVSKENKMIYLIQLKSYPGETVKLKKLAWTFRPLRSNKVDGTPLSMNLASMNLYLPPN